MLVIAQVVVVQVVVQANKNRIKIIENSSCAYPKTCYTIVDD